MEQFCRPATLDDLKLLLRSLNEHQVEYLLIGGYALAAHGYQRATIDIDVLIPPTRNAGQRLKEALMVLPDQAAQDLEPEWFEEGENIRVADAFVVDKCSYVVDFKIVAIIAKNVVCVLNQAILRPRDELPPMVLNVFP